MGTALPPRGSAYPTKRFGTQGNHRQGADAESAHNCTRRRQRPTDQTRFIGIFRRPPKMTTNVHICHKSPIRKESAIFISVARAQRHSPLLPRCVIIENIKLQYMRAAQWGSGAPHNRSDAQDLMQRWECRAMPNAFVPRRRPPQPFLSHAFLARRMPSGADAVSENPAFPLCSRRDAEVSMHS